MNVAALGAGVIAAVYGFLSLARWIVGSPDAWASFMYFLPLSLGGLASIAVGLKWTSDHLATARRARGTADEFRRLFETLPTPLVIADAAQSRILFVNQRAREQFGCIGGELEAASMFQDPTDQRRIASLVRERGVVENLTVELRCADGSARWALVSAHLVQVSGVAAIASSFADITDLRVTEEALLNSEIRYALISRATNDGIWDWDISTGHVYYSARWREIVAVAAGVAMNSLDDWFGLVHPDDLDALRHAVEAHVDGATRQLDVEYRLRNGEGRYCWMQCRAILLRDRMGRPIRMAGSQSDITLRKSYELNLHNAAYEDRLTGLNNRTFLTQLIDTKTDATAIRGDAILLLNLDQFKRVNDNLGTGAGDALLIALARRLVGKLKPEHNVARLSADEFAIYLPGIGDAQSALRFGDALITDLSEPFILGDAQLSLSISAGLGTADLGGTQSGADLLHHARLALDRSKQLGGDQCTLFDDALLYENKLQQRLSRDLAIAGRMGQISLDYQPLVSLDGGNIGEVMGFEALMRWRHPDLGPIAPARFIPLAEDAGIIGSLGILAIEQAASTAARWIDAGLTPAKFSIAVNLSVRQIADTIGIRRLYGVLDRLDLPRGSLKLEITESVLMSDPDEMVKVLSELRERGFGVSLDDFGTGYSSLSYLHRFPLDVLKVDRSFTAQMLRSPEALRLVRSIIDLGHDLGLTVVAEGVECIEQVDYLREMKCDFAQGYYFSKPLPAPQAEQMLVEGAHAAQSETRPPMALAAEFAVDRMTRATA